MTRQQPLDADVIVVGGGFSGLAAAEALVARGAATLVFEARDRIGGRVKAGTIAGRSVDLGGMWLGPTQTRLAALAERFGVERYPTHLAGASIVEHRGRRVRAPGENNGAMEPADTLEFMRLLGELEQLRAGVDTQAPWRNDDASLLDGLSVGEWLRSRSDNDAARASLAFLLRALLCTEPDQVSLLFFLFYLASGEGVATLASAAEGGAQNFAFDGGLHQIAGHMRAALGDRVRLSEPVQAIVHDPSGVSVRTDTALLRARAVIVAMSPPLAGRLRYEPPLPHQRDALCQHMPMGRAIKCWVAYASPFWREAGLNGFLMSDAAPFSPIFDVTPPGSETGLLCGFFDGKHASEWSPRSPEARRAAVLDTLAGFLGADATRPIDYTEQDWITDAWSLGCYGAVAPPGVLSSFGAGLREPVGRIFWAGTESSDRWSGYVEGAILSGERAAAEALQMIDVDRAQRASQHGDDSRPAGGRGGGRRSP